VHGPRGTEAKHSLYVYRFHPADGSLVLLHITDSKDTATVVNPAFSRFHPRLNVVYACTEDCENNGQIFAFSLAKSGMLQKIGQADAGGTSTCYLTIDKAEKNLIATNYWSSTLTVIPLDTETGAFAGPIKSVYDPKGGKEMKAAAKKSGGVNHSLNDDSTIAARQADPHSHALVLDPFYGCVAYVPDLGKDLIRELLYDRSNGELKVELNSLPSGLSTGKADGPRYVEFHPSFNTAYVVNELSSTVS
jgi:6-phosphogluconolactonase